MIHNEGLFKLGLLYRFIWEQGIPKFHGESPRSLWFNGNLGLNDQFSEQAPFIIVLVLYPTTFPLYPVKKMLNQLNPYISQGIPMNTLWNSHVLWPNHMKSTLHPSLVGGIPTLWKIWVRQLGWLFPILGKIKAMFQTTNQITIEIPFDGWIQWLTTDRHQVAFQWRSPPAWTLEGRTWGHPLVP